jgi:hypothetical protein
VDDRDVLASIEARLAEGNELMRDNREALDLNREALDLNREALDLNRQFMYEMLLRFDKALERSDARWRATLDRYFGADGGADPAPS